MIRAGGRGFKSRRRPHLVNSPERIPCHMKYIVNFLATYLIDRGVWKPALLVVFLGGGWSAYSDYSKLMKSTHFANSASYLIKKCDESEDECHIMTRRFISDTQNQYSSINPMRCVAGFVAIAAISDSIITGVTNDALSINDLSMEQAKLLDQKQERRQSLAARIQNIPLLGYCFL